MCAYTLLLSISDLGDIEQVSELRHENFFIINEFVEVFFPRDWNPRQYDNAPIRSNLLAKFVAVMWESNCQ
jgi:hypothetical protein